MQLFCFLCEFTKFETFPEVSNYFEKYKVIICLYIKLLVLTNSITSRPNPKIPENLTRKAQRCLYEKKHPISLQNDRSIVLTI